MAKIYIAYGHGGKDPGAVKGSRQEKAYNLNTGLAVSKYLRSAGHTVTEYRTSDTDYGLNKDQRINDVVKKANASGADYFIDVHYNAGGGKGVECYHTLSGGKGKTVAEKICPRIAALGFTNRGAKVKAGSGGSDYFGVIRSTSMPANLVECAFIDTDSDMVHVDEVGTDAIGKAIAQGICDIYGGTISVSSGSSSSSSSSGSGSTGGSAASASGGFMVKIKADALNIRKGAGTNYAVVGVIRDKGTYTIAETNSDGSWGKLKSGAGWICITNTYATKVSSGTTSGSTSSSKSYAKGTKITLKGVKLYSTATSTSVANTLTGTYYLYDGTVVSNRMRITNSAANVGKSPIASYVTGFINKSDI